MYDYLTIDMYNCTGKPTLMNIDYSTFNVNSLYSTYLTFSSSVKILRFHVILSGNSKFHLLVDDGANQVIHLKIILLNILHHLNRRFLFIFMTSMFDVVLMKVIVVFE
jgi:hypothetical protein